jgi:Zn-dependent protease with chaperone function
MQSLIANSSTGLLVGFVLGDMTGLSVAGAVGSALIDNRFSRNDEAQADAFAARTAQRLGFRIHGLVDLLERVAGDDRFSRAMALFSNHPLTDERRAALEALDTVPAEARPAFTDAEWNAIRAMCPAPAPWAPFPPPARTL